MKYEQGLREAISKFIEFRSEGWANEIGAMLDKYPSPVKESLAELADRKGYWLKYEPEMVGNHMVCVGRYGPATECFQATTYAQCEQSAREYLEGLEDKI
jgi:hypothetical protein